MLRWITALAVLTVLAAGALVNSQQASLSVPDWPLSYGTIIMDTPWVGGIRFEHSHRLLAASAAVLLITLPALTRTDLRRKRLAWTAFALYVVQIALGGAIVLLGRPRAVSALHAILAQAVAVLVLLAVLPRPTTTTASPGRWIKLLSVLVVVQPIAGVLARHPFNQTGFIVALLAHLFVALLLLVVVPATAIKTIRKGPPLRAAGIILFCLFVAQIAVGIVLFIVSPEPLAETWPPHDDFPPTHVAHVLLAAALAANTFWLRQAGIPAAQSG